MKVCHPRCGLIRAGYLGRRPVVMGKPLSVDLRVRAVEAIGAGMSRRAATVRNTNL